ncbi:hypothetical protein [Methanolapillus millepedarum]|uniref:Uncharacterized protein n=1 Tax=Methanolapillus millepedarum TaxID=3028296 RepID=A0AA96ZU50_9EURY|nr:hypothetical protein MsAc7_07950 [Methanosarcinaceae archaeon Ac7]
MTELTLTHKIEYNLYRAEMEINEPAEDREKDILPFLMFVNHRKHVDEEIVNLEYFKMEKPQHPYGRRMLAMMEEEYKLIERERSMFRLTGSSEEMVKTGKVMLPHRGIYEITVSDDRIFKNSVIGCLPDEFSIKKDLQEMRSRKPFKEPMDKIVSIPNVNHWKNTKIVLPLQGEKVIEVMNVLENGCGGKVGQPITVKIVVNETGSKATIIQDKDGDKKGNKKEEFFQSNFSIEYSQVVGALAELNGLNPPNGQFICFTEALLDQVSGSLTMKLKGGDFSFGDFGTYRISDVDKIQVAPLDYRAAAAWVEREVQNEIKKAYVTKESFNKIIEEKINSVCASSKKLSKKSILNRVLDYEKFIEFQKTKEISERDDVFWHTVTVSDLSME